MAEYVAQCGGYSEPDAGGFLTLVHAPLRADGDVPVRNGERLSWTILLDQLIWLVKHPGWRADDGSRVFPYMARSAGSTYTQVTLDRTMMASQLARLLDVPLDDLKFRLLDYLVIDQDQDQEAGNGDDS